MNKLLLVTNNRIAIFIIIILSLLLNINTLSNQYALDDEMVITKNMAVQQGFAGIPKILTSDAYQSFLEISGASSPLTGGRYRPLSIISFAIEQQLFGKAYGNDYLNALQSLQQIQQSGTNLNQIEGLRTQLTEAEKNIAENNKAIAPVRHAMQVFYFTLLAIAIWYLLSQYVFKQTPLIALAATLLFIAHPIHTEVIANLKSRDEIFSLLFIALTLIYILRYTETPNGKNFASMVVCFVLALLSKEYALLVPALAIVIMYTLYNKNLSYFRNEWFYTLCVIAIAFMFYRYSVISTTAAKTMSTDLVNNPYQLATPIQKTATKIYAAFEYIKLLVWPHPLSADYSYSQIPYVTFTSVQVWVSVLFFITTAAATVYLFIKRSALAFPLALFMGFFFMINNFLFDIGATMGERLIFHSSLGFCMLIAAGIYAAARKLSDAKAPAITMAITAILLLPLSYKTIARNPDWHNNFTLFTRDVKYAPNSCVTNCNAGAEFFNKGYFAIKNKKELDHADTILIQQYADTAIGYLEKAVAIYPGYTNAYVNLGICYLYKGNLDEAGKNWSKAARLFNGVHPTLMVHSKVLLTKGLSCGYMKDYRQASVYLGYAADLDPTNVEIWTNLAGSQFAQGNFAAAVNGFKKALELNPMLNDAKGGLQSSEQFLKLETECHNNPDNITMWLADAAIFNQYGFGRTAHEYYNHVLQLKPNNTTAKLGSESTRGKENKK
jgi:tetratricopeptide (TPR) repeat protein